MVSEHKHTPGPWRFIRVFGRVEVDKRIVAYLAGDEQTSTGTGGDPGQTGISGEQVAETLANGQLIAAAPEMLEALTRICAEAESWHSVHGHGEGSTQCDSICQLIPEMQRAIRKARGPQ